MAVPRNEFYLFRWYSKAIKEWLNENLYISRYPQDQNVLVTYMTPPRAFVKFIVPIINGMTIQPTVAFHLSNMRYIPEQNHLGFVRHHNYIEGSKIVEEVKPPMIYELTYSLILYTILQSDMDVLIYQALTEADPHAKAVKMVDGQWAEIRAGDPRDETTLEPGDAQDKVIRFGLDLTVPRAYLPKDYREFPSIEDVDVDNYAFVESSEEL